MISIRRWLILICLVHSFVLFSSIRANAQSNDSLVDAEHVYVLKSRQLKDHICVFNNSQVVVFKQNKIVYDYKADDLVGAAFVTEGDDGFLVICNRSGVVSFMNCRNWKCVKQRKLSINRYLMRSLHEPVQRIDAFKGIPGTSWLLLETGNQIIIFWNSQTNTYKAVGFDTGGVPVIEEMKGDSKELSDTSAFWAERMMTRGHNFTMQNSRLQTIPNGKHFVTLLGYANPDHYDSFLDIYSFPELQKERRIAPGHANLEIEADFKGRVRDFGSVLCCGGINNEAEVVTFNCQRSVESQKLVFGFAQHSNRTNRWKTLGKPKIIEFGEEKDLSKVSVLGEMNIEYEIGVFFIERENEIHIMDFAGKIDQDVTVPQELDLNFLTHVSMLDRDKLVVFNQEDFEKRPNVHVYCLSTGKWKQTNPEGK